MVLCWCGGGGVVLVWWRRCENCYSYGRAEVEENFDVMPEKIIPTLSRWK